MAVADDKASAIASFNYNNMKSSSVKIILTLSLLIAVVSCKHTTAPSAIDFSNPEIKKKGNVIKINVETQKTLKLSEIATEISYLILESTPETTIGNINKILLFNDLLFIADKEVSEAIYCFDTSGRFKFKISAKGRGPGEYLNIEDIDINREKKLLLVYDRDGGFINEYDLNGNFVRRYFINLVFDSFRHIEGTTLLAYSKYYVNPDLEKAPNSGIFTFDYRNIKNFVSYSTFDTDMDLSQKVYRSTDHISCTNDMFYIYDFYLNSIFVFSNDSLSIKWVIDFGNKNIPLSFYKTSDFISLQEGIMKGTFAGGLENFAVVGDWVIGVYGYLHNMQVFYYNYKTNYLATNTGYVVNDFIVKSPFIADFPCILVPPYNSFGNCLVSVVEPAWISTIRKKAFNMVDIPEELADLDIYSNPVLQIIKLK